VAEVYTLKGDRMDDFDLLLIGGLESSGHRSVHPVPLSSPKRDDAIANALDRDDATTQ